MLIKRSLTVIAVLSVALSTVQIAQADFMQYNGQIRTKSVDVRAKNSLAGRNFQTSAGQVKIGYQGVDYLGHCVDVFDRSGSAEVTEAPYTVLRNGGEIAYLFETNSPDITTREQAAGLQVAIWELLYEKNTTLDFNLDSGNFKITNNNVIDDANGMLDYMRANMPDNYLPTLDLVVLQSPCKQDMLIGREPPVIPEPATVTLLAIGGLLILKKRRRTAVRTA
ncbi:MAG: PEP-CTERM sorting domain-containing protein [Phycisphaerae bacterium]|jgi:hypothetical protein|nr:PEP-CTERM sorting domain-containing protein [Phycisphaerae bacterium]